MLRKISKLEHKNVLITGGCGFIGGHLSNVLLDQGVNVSIIDNLAYGIPNNIKKFKELGILNKLDINDLSMDNALFENIDCIFHLAAENIPSVCEKKPIESFTTNIKGTFTITQLGFINKVKKIVFTSSAFVYSQPPLYLPIDERHPISKSQSFYGSMKLLAESICWDQRLKYPSTSIAIARLFNVYGPGQTDYYVIPKLIKQCLNNKIDTIDLWEGESTRDFMYIEDVLEGLILLANKSGSVGPINLGSGEQVSIKELVEIMISLTSNKKIKFTKPDVIRSYLLANNALALSTLGWEPKIRIRQGLEEIIKRNI